MISHKKQVVFIQGFGSRDLFTYATPTNLWGWRRNVGLLIQVLKRHGILWKERFASRLSDVHDQADLFILRDWRYRSEDIDQFCQHHAGTPVVAMLFQCPRAYLDSQRHGDEQAVSGLETHDAYLPISNSDEGLFMCDRVIVRSRLNAELFTNLGYPTGKMVLMAHAPLWDIHDHEIIPLTIPFARNREKGSQVFNVLFIGESLWRKGLIHLYRAFRSLPIQPKRLHIYSGQLLQYARWNDLSPGYKNLFQHLLTDGDVIIHDPYRDIAGLVKAYQQTSILVCPSLLDCGPNVLMEAYQIGARAIHSDLSGIWGDFPNCWSEIVRAPRYWERFEPFGAFAERLSDRMLASCATEFEWSPALLGNLNYILETILTTWENLLKRYSIV